MNREPLVYIILVNYNGYEYTMDCLKSLKNIHYCNYKIVVVDNNSRDGSQEKFTESENIHLIFSRENLGFAGGNNIGIKYAVDNGCEYVLLLNNDTVVKEDFLNELVETAEKDKDIAVVGGKIFYYDNPKLIWYAGAKINEFTAITRHLGDKEEDRDEYNKLTETDYVTGCLMLVNIEALKKVGLMDEKYFLYYEETDWNVKFRKYGYKVVYNPKSVIYHKVSSTTSKQNDIVKYYYDRNAYYFVMNNFGVLNKIFMYFYMRLRLFLKYIKYFNETKKRNIIIDTYRSIKEGKMGVYNP